MTLFDTNPFHYYLYLVAFRQNEIERIINSRAQTYMSHKERINASFGDWLSFLGSVLDPCIDVVEDRNSSLNMSGPSVLYGLVGNVRYLVYSRAYV
jgi:hypothetical protein